MVTSWRDHWDNIKDNTTYYTFGMLRGISVSEIENLRIARIHIPTIFIKLNKETKHPERAWEGDVLILRVDHDNEKICFRVNIAREITIPSKYRNNREGWYVEHLGIIIPEDLILFPPFIYSLRKTRDWREFEDYVYYLLKLVGIHILYLYKKQRGEPDGFFKFGNLAVIYDATLEENFIEKKKTQIRNYCGILKSGKIEFDHRVINVSSCIKQVWIITRGLPVSYTHLTLPTILLV